jgi:putative sigma-54 modulation protein
MYASIDSLVDKLDRQILRHKEKNANHRNNGGLKNLEVEQPEANPADPGL